MRCARRRPSAATCTCRCSPPTTSCSSTVPAAATATTTRRGSSTRPSASSSACRERRSRRRGSSLPDDCLFCRLVQDGDHVRKGDGFVAVRDINPRADTHLLVIPERHVPTFREICEFPPDEAKRMLDFVRDTARDAGLEDYRAVVTVGEGGAE